MDVTATIHFPPLTPTVPGVASSTVSAYEEASRRDVNVRKFVNTFADGRDALGFVTFSITGKPHDYHSTSI